MSRLLIDRDAPMTRQEMVELIQLIGHVSHRAHIGIAGAKQTDQTKRAWREGVQVCVEELREWLEDIRRYVGD